ncbi:MAG: hypothetical protein AAFR14_13085, partial [Bacteroidota bacterium]
MKFYSFVLVFLFAGVLQAQDDDFFLRSEDEEEGETILESTQFGADDEGYYDDIVPKNFMAQSKVLDYEPLREIDVLWERRIWRVIDTREKMNQPFRNEDKPFFKIIQELADNGDIRLFEDEKFKNQLSMDQVDGMLNKKDTSVVYDPETYEEKIVITDNPIDAQTISRYRVKEVWYFDKE